jgi:DNA-directed RNA polymerase specialized sigma subunit
MDNVSYITLSKVELSKCLSILRHTNTNLKKWAVYFGARKNRDFRKKLFLGVKNQAVMAELESKIPVELLDQFRQECKTIISVHTQIHPDLDNRTVEEAMLSGFSALARRHAKRWARQLGEGNGMSLGDYRNEAYMALTDAIYGFTKTNISFTSFLWRALKNRMIYVTNKSNMMCPLTNPDLELLAKFEDTRRSFNEHVTFDQVAEAMGLDEKQHRMLNKVMTRVYSESQLVTDLQHGDGDTYNDYTSLRTNVHPDENGDRILKMSVRDAINKAGLTSFERIVLETSMAPYYGWQSDVARNNVNPTTGKAYTRMWVGMALKNAQEKIKGVLVA